MQIKCNWRGEGEPVDADKAHLSDNNQNKNNPFIFNPIANMRPKKVQSFCSNNSTKVKLCTTVKATNLKLRNS